MNQHNHITTIGQLKITIIVDNDDIDVAFQFIFRHSQCSEKKQYLLRTGLLNNKSTQQVALEIYGDVMIDYIYNTDEWLNSESSSSSK
ncbi:hypothetical protein DERP_008668 [Dermatophagoides pteronyssinus]|uniref:Uncharacterized protein n=1 Tax=Dermatophagoides pteronyssinus TaxID=6956 RepID=A0ABQ8IX21_DERPT|nr:hypothetical protein DERP_008668 [Dermatophagoides pteronyssinus]